MNNYREDNWNKNEKMMGNADFTMKKWRYKRNTIWLIIVNNSS